MAVISNPFLNEILEERFYPFLEHIKEFFGFGNEDEATLSRLELQSSTEGSRTQDVVHRTSSDSKVYQQTWKTHHHHLHHQNDEEFTAANSCCQKLTGRSNSSTTEPPKTPNDGHVLPSPPPPPPPPTPCEHGGSSAASASAAAAAARSGWLSRSPLRAFTSIPATIVAAPNADCSPTKNVGGTSSPSTASVSTRESNGRPSSDYAVPPHQSTAAAAATGGGGGGGGGGGVGIVSAYDCNPLLMFPSEEQLQSVEEPDYSTGEYLGRLQFSVSYDLLSQTLTVKVVRAEELAAKDLSGTSDPYVKIMLLPDKKNTMTTNIKRKNLNPRWNEVFAFEGFPQHKLLTRTLYLLVLDYDRFSRDDPIGEVCTPLRQMDLLTGQTVWSNLQPCKGAVGRLGALLLSLCYQPGIGCITLAIVKAKDLKAKDINGLSDPYVKIWLMHDGKRVEKKKTEVKEKTLNPTFNDSFLFSVPYERIRQTSLIVSVMDFDRLGRNEAIGQVLLGSKSGPMEVKHWNEMFAKTRQPVVQWHVLKDLG